MIGIRVMVQSLFRFSGYLALISECWQWGVKFLRLDAWIGRSEFIVLAALETDSRFILNKRKACIVYLKECRDCLVQHRVALPAWCNAASRLCFVDILKRVRMILLLTPTRKLQTLIELYAVTP